jgi:hypothetical protein
MSDDKDLPFNTDPEVGEARADEAAADRIGPTIKQIEERLRAYDADTNNNHRMRDTRLEDLRFYRKTSKYISLVTGDYDLSAKAINTFIPNSRWLEIETPPAEGEESARRGRGRPASNKIKPSDCLTDPVRQLIVDTVLYSPGEPMIIDNARVDAGNLVPAPGLSVFNTYRPTTVVRKRDDHLATLYVELVKACYPEEADLLLQMFAHMVQKPEEKVNFGVLLAGKQGVGKDLILTVMKAVVGWSNSRNVSPGMAAGEFNPFLRSVLLVIDEARPADTDIKAIDFYNKLKTMTTAPPDVVAVNDKHEKHAYTFNVCRVFITTNDSLSFYLPPDDRRWFVCQSPRVQADTEKQCVHLFKLIKERPEDIFGALLDYFQKVSIKDFIPSQTAPMTDRKLQILEHWGSFTDDGPVSRILAYLGDGDELPRVVFAQHIVDTFDKIVQQEDEKKPSRQQVVRILDNLGYQVVYPAPQLPVRAWCSGTDDPVKFKAKSGYRRPDVSAADGKRELNALFRCIAEGKVYKPKVVNISAAGGGEKF